MFSFIKNLFCETHESEEGTKTSFKRLAIILAVVFVIGAILAGSAIGYEVRFHNKIYPGVKIGQLNLGGLTTDQALDLLDTMTANIEQEGIKITYNEEDINLKITSAFNALSDPDLSREIITFDNIQAVEDAYSLGRSGDSWWDFMTKIQMVVQDKQISAQFELDHDGLRTLLEENFDDSAKIHTNAKPEITFVDKVVSVALLPEADGFELSYGPAILMIEHNLSQLNTPNITLSKDEKKAEITLRDVTGMEEDIRQVLATTTPSFVYGAKDWQISEKDLAPMIEFQKKATSSKIVLGLNYDLFSLWVSENIATAVEVKAKDAVVEIQDGKIMKFAAHQNGREINLDETLAFLNAGLGHGGLVVNLVVDIAEPDQAIGDLNDMGITEIIGTGYSNFSGSPYNRRHNIKTGADKLHGVLIKPGEEFQLVSNLTPINAVGGYLTELVIKGNKTLPEYGGGLCQIGTTIFRAAINSGLKITERRGHAYSVPYYLWEGKPGMDATIYDPRPDVRFVNDTGNYILIQSRIVGNDLYFEFWGTDDGRKVEISDLRNWGWVKPAETKYVETLDLEPGKQKCTESAHWGVSAAFDYKVTSVVGEVTEKTFTSRYKPWQAVCLIGVESLSSEKISTSTGEVIHD